MTQAAGPHPALLPLKGQLTLDSRTTGEHGPSGSQVETLGGGTYVIFSFSEQGLGAGEDLAVHSQVELGEDPGMNLAGFAAKLGPMLFVQVSWTASSACAGLRVLISTVGVLMEPTSPGDCGDHRPSPV
jgi:hypothetical protein